MGVSQWVQTRITQIASLTEYDGGGKDKNNVDSNAEFACLVKLLAGCEKDSDKQYVYNEMQNYLSGVDKHHFEHENMTSFDEVYDSTGNRMYIGYDTKGNMTKITTTYINEKGIEVSNEKNIKIELPENQDSQLQVVKDEYSKADKKSFVEKYLDNVKQFYSDLTSKGIKEAYTNYWGKLF